MVCLVSVSPRQCDFPSDWVGAWHHLGYDQPINVTRHHIEQKVGGDTSPELVRCTSLKLEKKYDDIINSNSEFNSVWMMSVF